MHIPKFSFGIGDRFTKEGSAQLSAFEELKAMGIDIAPVWNKSEREHKTVGTAVESVRKEADEAVSAANWNGPYFVDADHIRLENVDKYTASSDFFTLDVADDLASSISADEAQAYLKDFPLQAGTVDLPNSRRLSISSEQLLAMATKFTKAVQQAKAIYQVILKAKGEGNFITEVSMDEVDEPQSPEEMLYIMAALSKEGVPADTIAPRFPGRFNKGVQYVGSPEAFEVVFDEMLAAIEYAVQNFGSQPNLKLSVHSGSDKFAIYEPIRKILKKRNAGIHVKTAGTTWLEECIGLAEAGETAWLQKTYSAALQRWDELCGPYASVIDIDPKKLPSAEESAQFSSQDWLHALQHQLNCPAYNPDLRQLFHVGYKLAAEDGDNYLNLLEKHRDVIAKNVKFNLLERHLKVLFA